jgi:anaerobic dimethyl sulfoxide reductase subunit A
VHSGFDNVPNLREAFPDNLDINTADAEERGIKTGDTVLVTSKYGKILRHANVTNIIFPGVTRLDECAWIEIDPDTGIDKAGNPNMLNSETVTGAGIQAYNSCNVQVEKYGGAALQADCLWPQRVVEV